MGHERMLRTGRKKPGWGKLGRVIREFFAYIAAWSLASLCFGCSDTDATAHRDSIQVFVLDDNSSGCVEKLDNLLNLSVVSSDDNTLKAEYKAGFVYGHLLKKQIIFARDNAWDSAYIADPSHSFPKQIPPSEEELDETEAILKQNYSYTIDYTKDLLDKTIQGYMKRLIFRLLGVYHGVILNDPDALDFSGDWLPSIDYFLDSELSLNYETEAFSFMDLYFINAQIDLFGYLLPLKEQYHYSRCTAFMKKVDGDIFMAHNSWSSFLGLSMAGGFFVNGNCLPRYTTLRISRSPRI